MAQSVNRPCQAPGCRRELSLTARSHARTCSARCRQALARHERALVVEPSVPRCAECAAQLDSGELLVCEECLARFCADCGAEFDEGEIGRNGGVCDRCMDRALETDEANDHYDEGAG